MRLNVSVRMPQRCYHRLHAGAARVAARLALLSVIGAGAADAREPAIEAEAWVELAGPAELARLSAFALTVDHGRERLADGRMRQRVLATRPILDALAAEGLRVEVIRDDHRLRAPPGYHHPDDAESLLDALAARSTRAEVVDVGLSGEGRRLFALRLGRDPDDGVRAVRILGAHHGDEPVSAELALAYADALVDGDGVDTEITELLDTTTVWVWPWVNPDGAAQGSRYDAFGVDLNRNYDYQWAESYSSGDAPFSQPETRAVRDHGLWWRAATSLSLHSGAENIGWPWNYTTANPAEADVLEALAEVYAEACGLDRFDTTQGADWYITRGDTNDWSLGRYGGLDFTVEISNQKTPSLGTLPGYLTAHLPAVHAFTTAPAEWAGTVVAADTGEAVEARLAPDGEARPFWTTPTGRFDRPASGAVTVSAPGYLATRVTAAGDSIALVPVGFRDVAAGRPEPALIERATVTVTLPGVDDGDVTLTRPGAEATVTAADGRIVIDAADWPPGPVSIVAPDGTAWPRALFVADDTTFVAATALDGDVLVLDGTFRRGARAYALYGERRPLVPLPVTYAAEQLRVDLSATPTDTPVDVVVWSGGDLAAIVDVRGAASIDTGAPADTGPGPVAPPAADTAVEALVAPCGCDAAPASWLAVWLAAPLVIRRRYVGAPPYRD